jgi:thiosulfate dehydrogenase [quinone] large subunit
MNLTRPQITSLVVLRLLVGWHFLYEGVTKLYNPYWSAKSYLLTSEGWFRPLFVWLAEEPMIGVVDIVNMTVLIGVGVALMLGVLIRTGAVAGIVMLLLYYLAHPPFHGMAAGPATGNFWMVNYNLIEIAALVLVYHFPTRRQFGLGALAGKSTSKP